MGINTDFVDIFREYVEAERVGESAAVGVYEGCDPLNIRGKDKERRRNDVGNGGQQHAFRRVCSLLFLEKVQNKEISGSQTSIVYHIFKVLLKVLGEG